jgi:hypothetical protein
LTPYNLVVGGLHLLLGILLLSILLLTVTYRYPGTPPRSLKEEL